MSRKSNLIIVLFFIFIFSFSSGIFAFSKSANLGNLSSSLNDNYAPGESLKGWINISLTNEPFDSKIIFLNNSVKIMDIIRANGLIPRVNYNCSSFNCNLTYSSNDSGATSLSFILGKDQKKVIGFKVTESDLESITDLFLNISSGASEDCSSPLKVDIGDDGTYDWTFSKESIGNYCATKNYGCYTSSTNQANLIKDEPYCQIINISATPGLKVGANIVGSGNANISFLVDDSYFCSVAISSGGEISCDIHNLSFSEASSISVCIKQNTPNLDYKVYYDSTGLTCGDNNKDFSIFVQPIKYASIGSLILNLTKDQESFAGIASQYISDNYNNDCSDGCFIPFAFYSNQNNQQINITNARMNYRTGISISTENIYNLFSASSKINMPFTKLNLSDLGLKVSNNIGVYNVTLKFNDLSIITKQINVLGIPTIQEVYPLEVPAGANIYFTAVGGDTNITSYEWDFGDNSSKSQVTSNQIRHAYGEIKKYNLTLTVRNSLGESTKSFQVNVISPKNYLPLAFEAYKKKISNIKNNTNAFPLIIKAYIEKKLDLAAIEIKIAGLESKYRSVNNTLDYVDIANSLLTVNLPENIISSSSSSGSFIIDKPKISIPVLVNLTSESIDGTEESVKNAILEWFVNSLSVNIDSKSFTALYENSSVPLASYFNVHLVPKSASNLATVYGIIAKPKSSLEFGSSGFTPLDLNSNTGFSFDMSSGQKTFDFLIANEEINIFDIPLYFSPSLSKLSVGYNVSICNFNNKCESGENSNNCRADCKPWGKTVLWLVILLIVFLLVYIVAQEWYKKRYESYLFKDSNDLFNLVHFISNAEKQGLVRSEIFDKLKEKEWHGEQIIYAYKKFKGERTGMWEIPILRHVEQTKINREVDIRNKVGFNPKIVPKPAIPFVKQQTFMGKPVNKQLPVNNTAGVKPVSSVVGSVKLDNSQNPIKLPEQKSTETIKKEETKTK